MALAETTQEAIYLQRLLSDVDMMKDEPIQLYGDNQGSISIVKNPVKHNRTKHIDIKYHFIRECFSNGTINVNHVNGENNVADIMTKPLPKCKFTKYHKSLFGTHSNTQ